MHGNSMEDFCLDQEKNPFLEDKVTIDSIIVVLDMYEKNNTMHLSSPLASRNFSVKQQISGPNARCSMLIRDHSVKQLWPKPWPVA